VLKVAQPSALREKRLWKFTDESLVNIYFETTEEIEEV